MSNRFLTLGIDHGTSNSAIAVLDDGQPRVIKPHGLDTVMPSAVYIDRRGRTFVGTTAVQAMKVTTPSEGQGHTGYKPYIGQDNRYDFAAAQKVHTAPELGAMVLRELLKAYREESGADTAAAVITVPAKFEQASCDGTVRAARMAGLEHTPLVMEPIAAALAYGFTAQDTRAKWIVFDLGGGTLDISLVQVRDGQLDVPVRGHHGDNRLGGRNFDRMLMDHVLGQLRQQFALASFGKNDPRYATAWGRLELAVEEAKIALSRQAEAVVVVDDPPLCDDEDGRRVEVRVPVKRSEYEALIAGEVERAVHLCHVLLQENRLSPADIDRLILVGGPTKTPYLKGVLRDRLGIQLEDRIDPMTAVAQGAALHAATERLPSHLCVVPSGPPPAVRVKLEYAPSSSTAAYPVVGRVEDLPGEALTVEMTRTDGGWASGAVPVDEDGVFAIDLMLMDAGRPYQSKFRTVVCDASGRELVALDEPVIWFPFPESRTRLANSLRVGLEGNATDTLVKQGANLPASSGLPKPFVTNAPLRRGHAEDVLEIPVLEGVTNLVGGEDDHADCNVRIGVIRITGADERVTRDLPSGSEVLVVIDQDESRRISARVSIPILDDEEFPGEWEYGAFGVEADTVAERFAVSERRLRDIKAVHGTHPIAEVGEVLALLERLGALEALRVEIERAKAGERDALQRAHPRSLELAGTLNHVTELQRAASVRHLMDRLRPRLSGADASEIAALAEELGAAGGGPPREALARVEGAVDRLRLKVERQPIWSLWWDWDAFVHHFGADSQGRFTARGTSEQIAIFNELSKLLDEIIESDKTGAPPSDALLQRARSLHERLDRIWPDLPAWRRAVPEPESKPATIQLKRGVSA